MKQKNLTKKQMSEIINGLWFKFAADQLSRTAHNYVSDICGNYETSHHEWYFVTLKDMCSDLVANNRRHIPYYLRVMAIYDANDLKNWLDYLKDEEIFSDKEVEILCNDYRRIAEKQF